MMIVNNINSNVGVMNIESNSLWIIIFINFVNNLKNKMFFINNCK